MSRTKPSIVVPKRDTLMCLEADELYWLKVVAFDASTLLDAVKDAEERLRAANTLAMSLGKLHTTQRKLKEKITKLKEWDRRINNG